MLDKVRSLTKRCQEMEETYLGKEKEWGKKEKEMEMQEKNGMKTVSDF